MEDRLVLAWFDVEEGGWGERFDFGVATWERVWAVIDDPSLDVNNLIATLGLVYFGIAVAVLLRSRVPVAGKVYAVGIVVLALGSQTLGARPRFALAAVPLFVGLAAGMSARANGIVLGLFAGLLGTLTLISTTMVLATP